MGTGIAEAAITSGIRAVLVKATPGPVDKARERIAGSLRKRVERGKMDEAACAQALSLLTVTDDRDALADCPIIVESIVEELDAKRELFADLVQRVSATAVLASNTSTLRLRDLASPDTEHRLVGMHFFSPVPAMSLVEIARLPQSDDEMVATCKATVEAMGKTVVPVIDSAGFVVNRLLVPYLVGSISAYAHGLAGAKDIDTAMQLGCNHPIGPLALCDLIGLDVVLHMSKLLYREFGDDRFRPPALLRRMVQDGHLGRKSKLGFFDYSVKPPVANREIEALISGRELSHAA